MTKSMTQNHKTLCNSQILFLRHILLATGTTGLPINCTSTKDLFANEPKGQPEILDHRRKCLACQILSLKSYLKYFLGQCFAPFLKSCSLFFYLRCPEVIFVFLVGASPLLRWGALSLQGIDHSTQNYKRKWTFLKKRPSGRDMTCCSSTDFDKKCQFWSKLGHRCIGCPRCHQKVKLGHV